MEFIVYWTVADIDRTAKEIGSSALGLGLTVSEMTTGVVSTMTSLVGCHVYYQHLLSARKARDTTQGNSSGTPPDIANVALTLVDNHLRLAKSLFAR